MEACTLSATAHLLCIPQRPDAAAPLGDSVRTETVTAMARSILSDHAWDRLPILADALEEAGCTNAVLLAHFRHCGQHKHTCWGLSEVLARPTVTISASQPSEEQIRRDVARITGQRVYREDDRDYRPKGWSYQRYSAVAAGFIAVVLLSIRLAIQYGVTMLPSPTVPPPRVYGGGGGQSPIPGLKPVPSKRF